jgi:UDP-2,3-diacylglucosamine pyrophosphatase LpxH
VAFVFAKRFVIGTEVMSKRFVDTVIISDVHLGTYGCHATELLNYLKSIKPGRIILNGDIVDIWQFRKRFWPKSHMKVVKQIISFASKGVPVYYITGNHDDLLRKFSDFNLGNFYLCQQLTLQIGDKKVWIFHGDVFDASIQHARWLAKLGGWSYDFLILLNRFVNFFLLKFGREKFSLSKTIKNSVKGALKYINDFEKTAVHVGIEKEMDMVICGHIHQPQSRTIVTKKGTIKYMNSGDWVENLTALEYYQGKWSLYRYERDYARNDELQDEEDENDFMQHSSDLLEKMYLLGIADLKVRNELRRGESGSPKSA